ncbi:MAG: sulfite exporter TauE/SafE family protein [Lachnospiraceae bacterium]|nr:sulfite exporter TauE/SafE family protein [Lachnospiraceae bacterium]
MTAVQWIICALCCCFATAVQTVSGFGFGILVMAMLPHVLHSTVECSVMVGLTSIVNSFAIGWRYRRKIRIATTFLPLIGFLPVSYLCISLAKAAGESILRVILGLCLVGLGLYFIFLNGKIRLKNTVPNAIAAGGIAGLLSGLFSTGGPPLVIWFLSVTADMEEYIGSMQGIFFIMNSYNSVIRGIKGMITPRVLLLAALAMAMTLPGIWLGRKAMGRISERQQKIVIYSLMIVSGILLLF